MNDLINQMSIHYYKSEDTCIKIQEKKSNSRKIWDSLFDIKLELSQIEKTIELYICKYIHETMNTESEDKKQEMKKI